MAEHIPCGDISQVPRGNYIDGCLLGGVVRQNRSERISTVEKDNGKWFLQRIPYSRRTGLPRFPKSSQYEYDTPLDAAWALRKGKVRFTNTWGADSVPVIEAVYEKETM